ncbi:MAG: ATP-binding cassette domain-containing protein [Opitutales bacterium]
MNPSAQDPRIQLGDVLLEAQQLGLRQDDRWLFRKLNLEVRAGEFLAIAGPSGVGKTSLLHVLAGLRKPTEGIVRYPFLGEDSGKLDHARQYLGIIFQELLLTPNATLLQNVLCGRLNNHSSLGTLFGFPEEEEEDALALLENLNLAADAGKWVAETSRGEQQRVAVARAMHQAPLIYLADEPVASLDQSLADRVLANFANQVREQAKAIACVLHDPRQIERFANRAIKLDYGTPRGWKIQIIERETP